MIDPSSDAASDWTSVLKEAMDVAREAKQGPVVGARFRKYVELALAKRGMEYPEGKKFGEILAEFPTEIQVVRRIGSDFLVMLPGERIDNVASVAPLSSLRLDLFEALTRVRDGVTAIYEPSTDKVQWVNDAEPMPIGCVALPKASFQEEIDTRRRFAVNFATEHAQSLELSLSSPNALSAFTTCVKQLQLGRDWHAFRLERLLERLREWALANSISWRSEWLSTWSSSTGGANFATPHRIFRARDAAHWKGDVLGALSALSDDELARISVPLDVVAAILRSFR